MVKKKGKKVGKSSNIAKKKKVIKTKKRTSHKKETYLSSEPFEKREVEEMDRGQVWSVDVLLAVVIFISIILIFYATIGMKQSKGVETLESEALNLKIELEKNNALGFLEKDTINEQKLEGFINETEDNYTQIKQDLGIKGDFCIYFEDEDGNLLLLDGNKTGIGSLEIADPKILIAGIPCGMQVS